ncbi:phospholipase ABHD3-like [Salminus brasiliensis]|uniref:phospholipase ABHD3-like n=1 Tax=Salminus brasiliensis TaxID=930266 RepID=UPI003B82D4FB
MLLSLLSPSELWTGCVDCISRPCTLLLSLVTASLFCLWGRKGQVPLLVCGDGFRAFLQRHCPIVGERFCPTPWCWGGRLQTLVRVFIKSNTDVKYRNELIRTRDGGQLSLDWVDNSDSAKHPQSSTRPTVLLLPGLTGSSQQKYILTAIQQATRHGYRCVVMNNRGFGGEELLTPLTFCAADTSDVETVVNHIKELYPQAPLLGAGVSLGGMLLLNYLARKGRDSKIIAGLTMSVIWDSIESSESLEQPINKLLFNRHLAANLCLAIKRHRKVLEKVIDVDHVLKARTIREFDQRFTSVMFGYKSCTDYYKDASPVCRLQQTTVPVLCLNAADDPFSPKHAFPVALAQRMPNVALLMTAHGGHIGFLDGLFPKSESYMDRLLGQFVWAAFEHLEDLREACSIKEQLTE